ncbi:MAG TPA: hypothetical protein VIL04_00045 [Solirubrobacterales bacterium]|jgi:hypothetical protein
MFAASFAHINGQFELPTRPASRRRKRGSESAAASAERREREPRAFAPRLARDRAC